MKPGFFFLLLVPVLLLNFCSTKKEIKTIPIPSTPTEKWTKTEEGSVQFGIASWYGDQFHGKRTADGEIYDMYKLTAAHKELPFHTLVEVINLDNYKKVTVRINDRGPFVKGRIIDLSKKAAQRIGIENTGTARVRLRIIKPTEIGRSTPYEDKTKETDVETETITETNIEDVHMAPPVTPTTSEPGEYYLQAGAFRSKKNAKRLLRRIQRIVPEISDLFKINYNKGFYKVVSSKMDLRDAAVELKNRLDEFGIDTYIKKE